MDLTAPFRAGGALARAVGFKDDGTMEEVSTEGEAQLVLRVFGEAQGLHRWEVVDCDVQAFFLVYSSGELWDEWLMQLDWKIGLCGH